MASWNSVSSSAPRDNIMKILEADKDENVSISQTGKLEVEKLHVKAQYILVGGNKIYLKRIPVLLMDKDGNTYPMIKSTPELSTMSHSTLQPSQCPSPTGRIKRSHSQCSTHTSPPDSPRGSKRSTPKSKISKRLFAFDTVEERPDVAARGRRPSQVQSRTRGSRSRRGTRGRGVQTGRATADAVSCDGGWRQGERIIEVCVNDENVPPTLREVIDELNDIGNAREVQQRRRRRNVKVEEEDNENEDEGFEPESSIADVLFNGDNSALKFLWSPMASFEGRKETFQPDRFPGPRQTTSCCYEAFRQFWDDEILEHIVRETNRYALGLASHRPKFRRAWYETNVHEVLLLFAFWMMLSIIKKPSISSCFSDNLLLKTDIFKTMFNEARYWNLNAALHFVDNSKRTPASSKLFCLTPIINHLNKKFSEVYTPTQDIAIDESLTLWTGPLSFKQVIKTKAARVGIKSFGLCESDTGYLWSFAIYSGKDRPSSSSILPKSTEIVIRLMRPLLNQGYRLFLDNWYNSPLLARFLKRNRTDCVGTLRKYRKDVPNLIKLAIIPEGTCIARHSGDVVAMAYQEKRTVYTISTCHGTNSVPIDAKPGKRSCYKPAVIADYNKGMGGVDRMDQMLEPYLIERKRCKKWYKKMFKRLLNVSIFNSLVIVNKSTHNEAKQLAFRLELVDKIIKKHLVHIPEHSRSKSFKTSTKNRESRLVGTQHFVVRSVLKEPGKKMTGKNGSSLGRHLCKWCMTRKNRPRNTVWKCEQCNVSLCLNQCFKDYHTVP